jgi:proteasome lid subunit RPN8/RPN11
VGKEQKRGASEIKIEMNEEETTTLSRPEGHGKINMAEAQIVLDQQMLEDMQSHAISTYPEECCGLMFGNFSPDVKNEDSNTTRKIVVRLRRMKNVFDSKERYHRYTIDPKEFLSAEKDAFDSGEEIVGVYHSHPNAPARPSKFDHEHAWPTLSYVVIEVRDRKVRDTKSWVLKEDRSDFLPEKIEIVTQRRM